VRPPLRVEHVVARPILGQLFGLKLQGFVADPLLGV
jgi:hypothetical protein